MANYTEIDKIWDKGHTIRGTYPDFWRKDDEGNLIRRASYGTQGQYGWEKDHKKPSSKGGSDNIGNLRPLNWEANRAKGDK